MCGAAATDADGVHLRDVFRHRDQRGHRPEWAPHVVLIESGGDDADAGVRELHADLDDAVVKELHFVDADDLHADLDARKHLRARANRRGFESAIVARDDFIDAEAIVDDRLENMYALAGP